MQPVELIMRTERRRKFDDAFRSRVVAEAEDPNVTVASVARKYDIALSLLYRWRGLLREKLDVVDRRAEPQCSDRPHNPQSTNSACDFVYAGQLGDGLPPQPQAINERPISDICEQRIDVVLSNGMKLSVGDRFNAVTLLRLIRILGGKP